MSELVVNWTEAEHCVVCTVLNVVSTVLSWTQINLITEWRWAPRVHLRPKQMAWEHTESRKDGTISLASAAEEITSKPPSHTPVRVEGSLVSMAIRHPENIIFKFHSTTYLTGLLVIGHSSLSLDRVPFGIPKPSIYSWKMLVSSFSVLSAERSKKRKSARSVLVSIF